MEANKVFGQNKGQEADKLNIDSIIARLLEGETKDPDRQNRGGFKCDIRGPFEPILD